MAVFICNDLIDLPGMRPMNEPFIGHIEETNSQSRGLRKISQGERNITIAVTSKKTGHKSCTSRDVKPQERRGLGGPEAVNNRP